MNDRATRRLVLMLVLACALITSSGCALTQGSAPAGSPAASGVDTASVFPSSSVEPAPVAPIPVAGKVLPPDKGAYLGVYVPPAPFDVTKLDEFEAITGKNVSIVMWYQPWAANNRSQLDTSAIVAVMRRGKVPMITWEPWDPGNNANDVKHPGTQPAFKLAAINNGKYDAYMRQWARGIRDLGGPVMLRPMHEMNGAWYPWSGASNGNTPSQYISAWKRMHRIFDEEGATNVTWVWSINHESVPSTQANRYAAYYPGDAYVDWTGISGFNWGTTSGYSVWQPYLHWYEKPLAYLKTINKPICIAEFATVEQGGSKAAWITDAYSNIQHETDIKAVIYFSSLETGAQGRQDWRVNTSKASLAAFSKAISPGYFVGTAPTALTTWANSLDQRQWEQLVAVDPVY
jgi:beta-mannanase